MSAKNRPQPLQFYLPDPLFRELSAACSSIELPRDRENHRLHPADVFPVIERDGRRETIDIVWQRYPGRQEILEDNVRDKPGDGHSWLAALLWRTLEEEERESRLIRARQHSDLERCDAAARATVLFGIDWPTRLIKYRERTAPHTLFWWSAGQSEAF